jgi:hypothetical protein
MTAEKFRRMGRDWAEGEGEMSPAANDDKSPLIDLINCIECNQTMKLEKAPPTLKELTSFNIAAACVTELS